MILETEELVQQAQSKDYLNFKEQAIEMLKQKTAEKLAEKGYFDRLSIAQGKEISEADDKKDSDKDKDGDEYKKLVNKKLKKYGVESPGDLKGAEKKKFFDEIDSEWEGDNEND